MICTARKAVSTQVGGQLANPTATVEGGEGTTSFKGGMTCMRTMNTTLGLESAD